jgi:hypothetical protein
MEKPDEAHSYLDMLTHHQIIKRFKKLFGRDMTPKERDIFFLPDFLPDATPAEERKISSFLDLVQDWPFMDMSSRILSSQWWNHSLPNKSSRYVAPLAEPRQAKNANWAPGSRAQTRIETADWLRTTEIQKSVKVLRDTDAAQPSAVRWWHEGTEAAQGDVGDFLFLRVYLSLLWPVGEDPLEPMDWKEPLGTILSGFLFALGF